MCLSSSQQTVIDTTYSVFSRSNRCIYTSAYLHTVDC